MLDFIHGHGYAYLAIDRKGKRVFTDEIATVFINISQKKEIQAIRRNATYRIEIALANTVSLSRVNLALGRLIDSNSAILVGETLFPVSLSPKLGFLAFTIRDNNMPHISTGIKTISEETKKCGFLTNQTY